MNTREADEITVAADDRHEGRSVVSVVHGNYITSLRVSDGELSRIRDAINAHLSGGKVTDAEAEWEYVPGEIWTDRSGGKHVAVQSGVIAPGYVDTYIAEGGDVLRRKVGPWETVTADTVREARS